MIASEYVEPTVEDQRIWRKVCCYGFHLKAHYGDVCAEYQARTQDHRDADLMLRAQQQPGRRMFDCYGDGLIPQWMRGLPRGWTP